MENRDVANAHKRIGRTWHFRPWRDGYFSKCSLEKRLPLQTKLQRKQKVKRPRTAMLCTNMNGTENKRILVIGNFKNPCCLKNCSIGVEQSANKPAWMTAKVFNKWIASFDKKMARKNRKILFFLESCSAHMETLPLKAVHLSFFTATASGQRHHTSC